MDNLLDNNTFFAFFVFLNLHGKNQKTLINYTTETLLGTLLLMFLLINFNLYQKIFHNKDCSSSFREVRKFHFVFFVSRQQNLTKALQCFSKHLGQTRNFLISLCRQSLVRVLKFLFTLFLVSFTVLPGLAGYMVHNLYKQPEYFVMFAKETATDGLMVNLILLSQVNIITHDLNKQWTQVRAVIFY